MQLPRLAALAAILFACLGAAARPPNVVVILTDDQGWGDLSIHGNTNLRTPRIDSLGRDGAMFERFYVSPVCSPTRAEFLTGRYHVRCGVTGTSSGEERLSLAEHTIAESFRAAGYATGAFGKWHNGMQAPYHPNARGFEEFYGFCSGHWGDYFSPPLEHNGRPVAGNGFIVDDLTDRAIAFIERHRDRPFFCFVPYNTPHTPMQVPDRFWDAVAEREITLRASRSVDEEIAFTRAALAMCENIDWNVGRILDRLDALHLADDTIVVFLSDNGPNSWRWNGGLKGRKGSTDEGGVSSPLLVRWPGKVRRGTFITQPGAAIDLFPTLADLARVPVGATLPLDGRSLRPLLTGERAEWSDRLIFSHWNGRVSVRNQVHMLDHTGELFDLDQDPGQTRPISAEQPEIADGLRRAREAWIAEAIVAADTGGLPYTVGHPGFPFTQLPARDGIAHGGITRSSRYPNASFFENWRSTDDAITWDVDVATRGRYAATLLYTCAAGDTGTELELSLNNNRTARFVTVAHDPSLRGMEHDRVPRPGESYVKDFASMDLGELTLAPGRGALTLRALKIPGARAVDVRAIHLELLD